MRKLFSFLMIFSVLSLAVAFNLPQAYARHMIKDGPACSCSVNNYTPKEFLAKSTAVFSGKVVKMELISDSLYATTFKVYTIWKRQFPQIVPRTLVVISAIDEAACGYEFRMGGEYLVYASWSTPLQSLTTGLCGKNKLLQDAGDDIADLGSGLSVNDITGRILTPLTQTPSTMPNPLLWLKLNSNPQPMGNPSPKPGGAGKS